MALKLMYITNKPEIVRIAESVGVDRIFVDMEYIGKNIRQGGMDTVQNHHTLKDVKLIAEILEKAELLVRVNPIHAASGNSISSKDEIDAAIHNGADILMLPYFKTVDEVETFISFVDGRAKTMPLLETPEAAEAVEDILRLEGLDEIFIGLNDLSLGYGKKFMFELFSDGTVEELCYKFKRAGIPYGFGGIGRLGTGELPAEHIIKEHYRLGSTCAILSRSFCDANRIRDFHRIEKTFINGIQNIRELEAECARHMGYFTENKKIVKQKVEAIVRKRQQETP